MGQAFRNNGYGKIGKALTTALMLTTAIVALSAAATTPVFAKSAATSFSVPAGSLSAALTSFARQSGLQVTYNPAIAEGRRFAGVAGTLAPADAVAILLSGSGLCYRFSNPKTVPIFNTPPAASSGDAGDSTLLQPIIVQGEKVPRNLFITYTRRWHRNGPRDFRLQRPKPQPSAHLCMN